jgi:Spy/CpxP family protein refolding chaperone
MVAGLVFAGGLVCCAQDEAPESPRGPEAMRAPRAPEELIGFILEDTKLAEKLGIAPELADRIRAALVETKGKEIDVRAAMEKAALRQAQLLTAKEIDEPAVLHLVDEIGHLRTELARNHMRNLIMIRRTLKPEQIEMARNLLRERFQDRSARWRERVGEREGEGAEWRERMKERARREREGQ